MTWYEVDATGMHELYPEVCNEDIFILCTLFGYVQHTAWADTLFVNCMGNCYGLKRQTSRGGSPRFLSCSYDITNSLKPYWVSGGIVHYYEIQ